MKQTLIDLATPENPHYPNILFYLPSRNRFMDHQFCIVHDLGILFATWQMSTWVQSERHALMTTKSLKEMMLYYLPEDAEEDILSFLGANEEFGVKTDRIYY